MVGLMGSCFPAVSCCLSALSGRLHGRPSVLMRHPCAVSPQMSMEKVQAMAEQVEIKAKVVQTEVKALVLRHKKALEERECELLWKVSGEIFGEGGCCSRDHKQLAALREKRHKKAPEGKRCNVDCQQ